ncbi:LytR/AlgR family response regulator transcription factor [Terriglobus saanensis]|uniref:Two component transcriptional regulator, LytTR family n=1 Tax=Terriglobus saanensis (strain ATCC BAA-1853 / DSM 23119 / SP1PR4) TaxID=401053 RepID=E8V2I5_TERSS|nr:LytTR family DNA-binding domain-containing protein [Terriglobus saanensis]ADV82403.1 two component transcriptional regulator, LytTR family [Terriglobus saanensis SP1PR4]
MTLRAVLVDDELLARQLLRLLLSHHTHIQIVAECKNGREAIEYLQSAPVDLLFLDVQMPGITGFDVVEQVGLQHLPPTIFVTAYQEHAVRAFDMNAIDYLTKPVQAERLQIAIGKVQEKITAKTALLTQLQLVEVLNELRNVSGKVKTYPSRLLVKDGVKEILLPVEAIEWIEAAEYYSCLHSKGRRFMLRETITDLANRLDPEQFVRIHRSSIVNLNLIREIYREGQEDGCVVLVDGRKLKMSKAGRQRLTETGKAST